MAIDTQNTSDALIYQYWGKALPAEEGAAAPYHLLAYHSLDVAAVGYTLTGTASFSLDVLAREMGWTQRIAQGVYVFFLVMHDLGKFARAFQNLAADLSPNLVSCVPGKRYSQRHDTLGWLLWRAKLADDFPGDKLPKPDNGLWKILMQACTGHHGRPPLDAAMGGAFPQDIDEFFCPSDILAARAFLQELAQWLLPDGIPTPTAEQREVLRRHSWRLAGLAVLADWLGSDQSFFRYHTQPMPLRQYWQTVALPAAERVVGASGVVGAEIRQWPNPMDLFGDALHSPTPLQQLVVDLPIGEGPQLFLLEDVTGAGKTEAALMLAYRLMAGGKAQGLYFGLPTMATANQMCTRLGSVYRKLYAEQTAPSLVLAHGARQLVGAFRHSIVQGGATVKDKDYQADEASASTQCSAWLADSRKKALLAQIGVGTLDQALLGVLPVRHQSLRLLGLSGKVLIVDEVHAYDPYMRVLLSSLLKAHANQGGSAILLSATVPAQMRSELAQAFLEGRGASVVEDVQLDLRYPLVTHAHTRVDAYACDTRATLRRTVSVQWLHDEAAVINLICQHQKLGRSVCWIRNTVGDARRAFSTLQDLVSDEHLTLFHSRYAMGDRLVIEDDVLARFGNVSTAAERTSQVLLATQVVEQSLDLDFDVLISDLAPIDLLIQRAGRLHRHVRDAEGNRAAAEGRPAPVLYVLGPEPDLEPAADWYSALFPHGKFVYPDVGQLWLTQQALLASGAIVSPGVLGECAAVRTLVEAVYGEDAQQVPERLLVASNKQLGVEMAETSQARFNSLNFNKGYCDQSSQHWYEDTEVSTRLGDETLMVFLAREVEGVLRPWWGSGAFAWEHSALRVRVGVLSALALPWEARFGQRISALREQVKQLKEPAFVLPLDVDANGLGCAEVLNKQGKPCYVYYDARVGLVVSSRPALT